MIRPARLPFVVALGLLLATSDFSPVPGQRGGPRRPPPTGPGPRPTGGTRIVPSTRIIKAPRVTPRFHVEPTFSRGELLQHFNTNLQKSPLKALAHVGAHGPELLQSGEEVKLA